MTHAIDSDGLCNYRCTACGWRYAHVGWGDPDTVAMNWFEDFHNIEGRFTMASTDVRYPNVEVKLSGRDGNAFAIMGAVGTALRKAGASKEEIQAYTDESTSGDYVELLQTAMRWVNVR